MARELVSGQGGLFVTLCREHAAMSWGFCPLEGELHSQPGAPRAGDSWGQLSRARTGDALVAQSRPFLMASVPHSSP